MPEFNRGLKPALIVVAVFAALAVAAIIANPAAAPGAGGIEVANNRASETEMNPLGGGAQDGAQSVNIGGDVFETSASTSPHAAALNDASPLQTGTFDLTVVDGEVLDAVTGGGIPNATIWLHFATTVKTLAARTAADGGFRIELPDWAVLEDTSGVTVKCAGYEKLVAKPVARTNRFKLYRETLVIVSFADTPCIPASTWLKWPGAGFGSEPGTVFDPDTGEAHVDVKHAERQQGACVARCDWLGALVESQPFEVNWGGTTRVELKPPAGASVTVRVIGPDSLPMEGVVLSIGHFMDEPMRAQTDSTGRAKFAGIAAPAHFDINVERSADAAFCVSALKAAVEAAGDRIELLLDLTGTGIIYCELSAGGVALYSLMMKPLERKDDNSPWSRVLLHPNTGPLSKIYGLSPGRYYVSASRWDRSASFVGEFEVSPPPSVSGWCRDFETRSVTVRVTGAPSTNDMVLHQWARSRLVEATINPNREGEFVIAGLSTNAFFIRVSGGGYASRVVEVSPTESVELELPVEASGMVHLVRRDGGEISASIWGAIPRQDRFFTEGIGTTLELPPGVYSVHDNYADGPPWPGEEFSVVAGEVATCEIGPPFTCTLRVRVKDRTELWDLNPQLLQGGETVACHILKTGRTGEQYHEFYFSAEGKFTLKLRGFGIELYEQEFEVSRGETVSLEVELKQKE
jgi:hypothetical protein